MGLGGLGGDGIGTFCSVNVQSLAGRKMQSELWVPVAPNNTGIATEFTT